MPADPDPPAWDPPDCGPAEAEVGLTLEAPPAAPTPSEETALLDGTAVQTTSATRTATAKRLEPFCAADALLNHIRN